MLICRVASQCAQTAHFATLLPHCRHHGIACGSELRAVILSAARYGLRDTLSEPVSDAGEKFRGVGHVVAEVLARDRIFVVHIVCEGTV